MAEPGAAEVLTLEEPGAGSAQNEELSAGCTDEPSASGGEPVGCAAAPQDAPHAQGGSDGTAAAYVHRPGERAHTCSTGPCPAARPRCTAAAPP